MITLLIVAGVLAGFTGLVALASLFLISRRDRRRLPRSQWTPIEGLAARECRIGTETVRYWEVPNLTPAPALTPSALALAPALRPTLVFFHGIGAWSYVWRDLVPLLQNEYRLILLDLPGFGLSSKNPNRCYDLDEQSRALDLFLAATLIEQPVLVGSSMGGAIALWMAKLNPAKVRAVIAISPAINGMRYWIPFFIPIPLVRTLGFLANRILFRYIMKNVIESHHRIDETMIDEYWRPFALDPESAVTFIKGLRVIDDRRLPYDLVGTSERLPICILWGARDQMTPVRDHKLLSLYLPQAEFFTHAQSGHHVMEDAPEWCAQKIIEFLAAHF